VLSELVEAGKLRIVGAVYSLDTGKVDWLPAAHGH
jgi:carbonic anhydrase